MSTNSSNQDSTAFDINICSWNIWCIPFGSPRTFLNGSKCARYLLDTSPQNIINSVSMQSMVDHQNNTSWYQSNGINIMCIQELWSWKIGIFPRFILRLIAYVEYLPILGWLISIIFQLLSFIFGLIFQLFGLDRKYNPKTYFAQKMKDILPYHVYAGDIPFPRFLDNGLMILSDQIPTDYGSEMYVNAKAEDYFAAKGFLWMYFADQDLLVINTHLQCAGTGDVRKLQLQQLKTFIHIWENKMDELKIIVCGDFNMDLQNFRSKIKTGNNLFRFNKNKNGNKLDEGLKQNDTTIEFSPVFESDYVHARRKSIGQSIDEAISNISHIRHTIDLNVNISEILEMIKISNFEPTFIASDENIDHIFSSWMPYHCESLLFTDEEHCLSDHKLLVVRIKDNIKE